MFHIQVPKTTATVQLFKPKSQAFVTKEKQEITKPAQQEFKSILTLGWGNSNTVQLTKDGDETEDENQTPLKSNKLNVVGENHNDSDERREEEQKYCYAHTKSSYYDEEAEFQVPNGQFGDPIILRLIHKIKWLELLSELMLKEMIQHNTMPANLHTEDVCNDLMKFFNPQRELIQNIWHFVKLLRLGHADVELKGNE